jgi:integrase
MRGRSSAPPLPAFGWRRLEDVSADLVERWARELGRDRPLSNRSKQKIIVVFHGLMERARRVWKLDSNPVRDVDRPRTAASAGGIDVFSPDEVFALVRHADGEQDGALFLAAAFTGLRQGELIAPRWRDVDFPGEHVRVTASCTTRALTSPKSGRVRSVPLAPAAAGALARLSQREHRTGDLVFPGISGTYLAASALRKRYKRALAAAGLRPLRFHDLRHTFGTTMIGKADIVRVQTWMGHADIETTRKYLHFVPRPDDARLVAEAFAVDRASVDFSQHRAILEKQASEEGRRGRAAARRGRGLPGRDWSWPLGRHVLPRARGRSLPGALLDLEQSRHCRQPRQADPPLRRPLPPPLNQPTPSASSSTRRASARSSRTSTRSPPQVATTRHSWAPRPTVPSPPSSTATRRPSPAPWCPRWTR